MPKATTVRFDDDLLARMQEAKDRFGIPQSEQMRRATDQYLTGLGIGPKKKTDRKRVTARRRP